MKSKQELEDEFDWWITCIPDKLDRLEELIPAEIFKKLDFTLESFNVLGKYIVDTTDQNSIQKEKELWDCFASYVGTTYKRIVPTAQWHLELDDEKNLYYGVPILRTKSKSTFVPHYEITTMLDRNQPDFLFVITKRHIQLQLS
jgi:hypothetical protein